MLVDVENSHAATYYAAWAQDARVRDAAVAASVAKAYASEACRTVCGPAIQVHGGIGFTWEYDPHLLFKRAKHLEPLYGDAAYHRELALRAASGSQPRDRLVPDRTERGLHVESDGSRAWGRAKDRAADFASALGMRANRTQTALCPVPLRRCRATVVTEAAQAAWERSHRQLSFKQSAIYR